MMRVILAGVLAGTVAFLWSAVDHVVLPLGQMGMQNLPGEESIVEDMRHHIQAPGFYFFPGLPEMGKGVSKEQQAAAEKEWAEKLKQGPSGIVVYKPGGSQVMEPRQLVGELLTSILCGLIAAILLSMAAVASFGARVFFVTLLGLFASISIDFSHWIWYGFPAAVTIASLIDQVLSWFFGGLVLAAMVKPRA